MHYLKRNFAMSKKNIIIKSKILNSDFGSNSVSGSNSDSDSKSVFMNVGIFIFFVLHLH